MNSPALKLAKHCDNLDAAGFAAWPRWERMVMRLEDAGAERLSDFASARRDAFKARHAGDYAGEIAALTAAGDSLRSIVWARWA